MLEFVLAAVEMSANLLQLLLSSIWMYYYKLYLSSWSEAIQEMSRFLLSCTEMFAD
jgi:hypothetical protein